MKKFFLAFIGILFVSAISHVSFASDVAPTAKVATYDLVHSDNVVIMNIDLVSNIAVNSANYVNVEPTYILGSNSVIHAMGLTILDLTGITTTKDNLSEIKYIAATKALKYKWPLIDIGKINTIAFNSEFIETLKVNYKRE